jgi:hypothetical protein
VASTVAALLHLVFPYHASEWSVQLFAGRGLAKASFSVLKSRKINILGKGYLSHECARTDIYPEWLPSFSWKPCCTGTHRLWKDGRMNLATRNYRNAATGHTDTNETEI